MRSVMDHWTNMNEWINLNNVVMNFTEFYFIKKHLKIREFHWMLNVQELISQSVMYVDSTNMAVALSEFKVNYLLIINAHNYLHKATLL